MKQHHNMWKRFAAWTLAASMVVGGGNSFAVLAESMPDSEFTTETLTQSENAQEAEEFASDFGAAEEAAADEWYAEEDAGEETGETADLFTSDSDNELPIIPGEGEGEKEGNQDYNISFAENLRTWVFSDEQYEVKLNTENLADKENVRIDWEVTELDESEQGTKIEEGDLWNQTENGISIDGSKMSNHEYEISAIVMVKADGAENESEVSRCETRIYRKEPEYRYYINTDKIELLVDEARDIDAFINCWVENSEYPYGDETSVEVTNVEIQNASDETLDTPVCKLYGSKEDEWWEIEPQRVGHAVLTVSYTDLQGKEQSYDVDVQVSRDKYYMEFEYPNGRSQMTTDSEMCVQARLTHQYNNSAGDGDEKIQNFTVKIGDGSGEPAYDETIFAEPEVLPDDSGNSTIVQVKSRDKAKDGYILLSAWITNANGEEVMVATENLYVDVTDSYTVITPENLENPLVGDILDLNEVDFQVLRYSAGEQEPEAVEGVTFSFAYSEDEGVWENIDTGADRPKLLRKELCSSEITVKAYVPGEDDQEDELIAEKTYFFNDLEYNLEFEDNTGRIYSDETGNESCLEVNTENLLDKENLQLEWRIGYTVSDPELGDDQFVLLDSEDGELWKASEDGTKLYINGQKLYEKTTETQEEREPIYEVSVSAYKETDINGEKRRIQVCGTGTEIESRKAVYEYRCDLDTPVFFYDESYFVPNYFYCYMENSDYPYGQDVKIAVDAISVTTDEVMDYEEGDALPDLCEVEKTDSGWWLHGKYCGCGKGTVRFTFTNLDGEIQTGESTFEITNTKYFITTGLKENSLNLLFGESIDVPVSVTEESHDPETGITKKILPKEEYTVFAIDENRTVEVKVVESEDPEQTILRITANDSDETDDWESISLAAQSKELNEEGNPKWATPSPAELYIETSKEAYILNLKETGEEIQPEITDLLDLNQYEPSVTYRGYDQDGKIQEKTAENIRYYLDYNENEWSVLEGTEKNEIPVLVRITADATDVNLMVEKVYTNKYGEEATETVTGRHFGFSGLFEDDGQHSWKEIKVVKESTCEEAGSREVICKTCGQTKTEEIKATGHSWKVTDVKEASCTAEGSKTYTCEKCKQIRKETIAKTAHNMVTVVDSEPTCGQAGKQHKECSLCHGERTELPDIPATGAHNWVVVKTIAASCTAEGSREYTCTSCKATKAEAIKKLAHNMVTVIDSEQTCGQAGKQHKECSLCHGERTELPELPATGAHNWGEYTVTVQPTAVKAGEEVRTCKTCDAKENRTVSKLKAFIKTTSTKFPLKNGQTLKVAFTLENGDSIKSVKSSNKKKLTVSAKGNTVTLKANKKAVNGKVSVVVKTAGGAATKLTVTLQEEKVTAKKITGISKKLSLKVKKKATLKPVVTPVSTVDKVTYKSSNKKVVTVNKKGVLTAKKAGKATITVTCGDVSVKCVVTVKK